MANLYNPGMINPRILNETAVRYFLQVVNSGSITDAAHRLHVVPSAVSRQIGRLEAELGMQLFERTSRGMSLSSAGELLAAFARRTQLDAEQVCQELLTLHQQQQKQIRIACTEGFASQWLPQLMPAFRFQQQMCSFTLSVSSAEEVTRRVREAEVDIGFAFSLGNSRDVQVAYRQPAPILAIVAPQHPLAQMDAVTLRELLAYPLAIPTASSTISQLLDIYCAREGVNYHSMLQSNHLETLLNFCRHSNAITFCGELFVRNQLQAQQLLSLPVPELCNSERSIEIQTMTGRKLPDHIQEFIHWAGAQLA
jgi:DNA-binding transcriptional LysR family regulator